MDMNRKWYDLLSRLSLLMDMNLQVAADKLVCSNDYRLVGVASNSNRQLGKLSSNFTPEQVDH